MALIDGMIRAARLDTALYEEVERDTTETNNALTVVAISAIATGIGGAIGAAMNPTAAAPNPIVGLIFGVVIALIGWVVWTGFVYFVGTRLFGGTATWGEVMRTVGYANSPGVLNVLSFVPVLGALIGFVVFIWTIVTTVVGVRQALDVGTGKAILAAIIGGVCAFVVMLVIAGIVGLPCAMASGRATPPTTP